LAAVTETGLRENIERSNLLLLSYFLAYACLATRRCGRYLVAIFIFIKPCVSRQHFKKVPKCSKCATSLIA
jgi:hypothetical protein